MEDYRALIEHLKQLPEPLDLRELLRQIKIGHTQMEIKSGTEIRQSAISNYLNRKSSLMVDNYEKIVNYLIKKL